MTVTAQSSFTMDELAEPVVIQYFETLNTAQYRQTALLFAPRGVLYPPFHEGVIGSEAIATYLETEAMGMQLLPRQGTLEILETGDRQYDIIGMVQTSLFGVNVGWRLVLNAQDQILTVQVKLLAALEELLSLRS